MLPNDEAIALAPPHCRLNGISASAYRSAAVIGLPLAGAPEPKNIDKKLIMRRRSMLKPFLMSLAMMSLGASAVGLDGSDSNPATWRWQVSQILDAQRASSEVAAHVGALDARSFDQ